MALPKSTYISPSVGRPTDYSPELANEIAERLMEGETLVDITKDLHMPSRATIYNWLDARPEFFDIFTRARRLQAHTFADELLIRGKDESRDYYVDDKGKRHSDNTAVMRDGLLCRNYMWLMERVNSAYALKNDVNVNVAVVPAFNVASATPIEHKPSEPVTVTQAIDNKEDK